MNVFSQEQIFIFFFIIGVTIAIIFDFFRAIRKNFKSSDIATIIQDIMFLFISGSLIIYSIIKLNNGEIRLFIFIGIFLGILMYSLTISKLCVIILYEFVKVCKKIFLFPYFCYKKVFNNKKNAEIRRI